MRRPVLLPMLFALIAGLLSQPVLGQRDLADTIEKSERAVVRIEVASQGGASLGSGFIVDESGLLVTNVHVMAGAQRAVAVFPNGRKFNITGTLLIDEPRDICVVKLTGTGFSTLKLHVEAPRKGERVTALGSPKGLSFSATTGIVSAIRPAAELGPEIGRPEIRGTWIQVDAALSGGNSGGPLINDDGEVVAMSTLASQGSAQNLNFGISSGDIIKAVKFASGKKLVPLADGVGTMKSGGSAPPANRPTVPEEKLLQYVEEAKTDIDDRLQDLREELARETKSMKAIKDGKTFLPQGTPRNVEIARGTGPRNSVLYFFRNGTVKEREYDRVKTRVADMRSVLTKSRSAKDSAAKNDVLYELLSNFGPRLDPQRNGSIGFLTDAIILRALTDHDAIVLYDEVPYLVWMESTAGLSEGVTLSPTSAYVAGAQTLEIPGQAPRAVTLLQLVTDEELHSAIFGEKKSPDDKLADNKSPGDKLAGDKLTDNKSADHKISDDKTWRVWRDKTGKFQVEAMLVEVSKTHVVLTRKDNKKKITVPLAALSEDDVEFLGDRLTK